MMPRHELVSGSEVLVKKNKVKTELMSYNYKSEFKILHGFWMHGDYFILVTLDRTTTNHYLEMYHADYAE